MDKESLKLLLGQGLSVERIAERFGKHPSTISYWMAEHGLQANNRQKYTAVGGSSRYSSPKPAGAARPAAMTATRPRWPSITSIRHRSGWSSVPEVSG